MNFGASVYDDYSAQPFNKSRLTETFCLIIQKTVLIHFIVVALLDILYFFSDIFFRNIDSDSQTLGLNIE